jgi:hypothetical protein
MGPIKNSEIGTFFKNEILEHPTANIMFALGTITVLAGTIGYFVGLNVITAPAIGGVGLLLLGGSIVKRFVLDKQHQTEEEIQMAPVGKQEEEVDEGGLSELDEILAEEAEEISMEVLLSKKKHKSD